MKKLIGVYVIICCILFVGCGRDSRAGGTGTSAAGSHDPFGKYTPAITLSTARTMDQTTKFDPSDPERRSLEENRWVRAFREDLGIDLQYKWISPDAESYRLRWATAAASGDLPDFAGVSDEVYKLLYEAGMIADMGDTFALYGWETLHSYLTPNSYQRMTMDGTLYGFPLSANSFLDGVLFVRKDWLDALGLGVPETIEDVIIVARAFKAAGLGGNDTIGILFSNGKGQANGRWEGFLNGYGAYIDTWLEKSGQLVYSSVQNEMKDALLAMQALYRDGIMNSDFMAINDEVAQEYIAGGKAGIFYSTSWTTTTSLLSLHNSDPQSNVINVFPPSVKGKKYPMQVGLPTVQRIFVSKKSKYPEAAVKMANLTLKYELERGKEYGTDPADGFMYFKFMPWDHVLSTINDLEMANAVREAFAKGTEIENPRWQGALRQYKAAKEGKAAFWYLSTFGEGGSYTTLYDAYKNNLLLPNAYGGLPTDTQSLKGNILTDNLRIAMYEVIMGASISVYEQAIEKWYTDGGRQITEEVNLWYNNNSKK
jgi:putative aldouronate transport system substrate-binding protein